MTRTAPFPLADYLQRIAYSGEINTRADTLKAVLRCHGRSIPFENLDVLGAKPISLEPQDLINKIIYGGRGGYCYENNGLLSLALSAMGFSVQRLAARPRIFPVLRPRTHMTLVVTAEDRQWLCDPAFGGYMPAEPLALDEPDREIVQGHDCFRLTLDPAQQEYFLHTRIDGDWQTQYSFNLCPQEWVDFAPGNYLNSTHPESFFRKTPVLVIFTAQGRKILSGDRLKISRDGQTTVQTVTPDTYASVLREHFKITGDYPEAKPPG